MTVAIVGAGPGDPGLVTVRARGGVRRRKGPLSDQPVSGETRSPNGGATPRCLCITAAAGDGSCG